MQQNGLTSFIHRVFGQHVLVDFRSMLQSFITFNVDTQLSITGQQFNIIHLDDISDTFIQCFISANGNTYIDLTSVMRIFNFPSRDSSRGIKHTIHKKISDAYTVYLKLILSVSDYDNYAIIPTDLGGNIGRVRLVNYSSFLLFIHWFIYLYCNRFKTFSLYIGDISAPTTTSSVISSDHNCIATVASFLHLDYYYEYFCIKKLLIGGVVYANVLYTLWCPLWSLEWGDNIYQFKRLSVSIDRHIYIYIVSSVWFYSYAIIIYSYLFLFSFLYLYFLLCFFFIGH